MKRYSVLLICLIATVLVSLSVCGTESFYTKYTDGYLILLPDNKSNEDLALGVGGVVYADSSLNTKASSGSIAGTGRYITVSGETYEIIVKGDSDGDGLVLPMDLVNAKELFKKADLAEREMYIFDVDDNGRYSTRDYLLLKAHMMGVKKLTEIYSLEDSSNSESKSSSAEITSEESSSVDPDWVNQCTVNLSNEGITVSGTGATVSGKVINITAGGEYTLSGTIADGMVQVNSTEKVKIRLSGANISNSTGPAILFYNAAKAYITIDNGTINYLSDGKSYTNGKGTVHSEVDLEIKGKGTLYVTSNYRHAICGDEKISVENGTIYIQSAVKDGIHAKKDVEISGGKINITNCGGDGIDCEGTSSGTKGTISILGGEISVSNIVGDGINAFGDVCFTGGTVSVSCDADGVKTDGYARIAGTATLTVDAGSDGVNSVKGITVTGGTVSINAVDYTLKSDANISVTGGLLTLEGVREKMYALGTIDVSGGKIQ